MIEAIVEKAIQAVVLDMDGVVGDTLPIDYAAWKRLFSEHGVELSLSDYKKLSGMRGVEKIRICLPKEAHRAGELVERKDLYFLEHAEEHGVKPVENVGWLLDMLRGENIGVALATSSTRNRAEWLLNRFSIADYFQAVIASEDVARGKPHPEAFLKAAVALAKEPAYCCGFEDTPRGVAAVKSAGMACIAIATNHPKNDLREANIVVQSYRELTLERIRNAHAYLS